MLHKARILDLLVIAYDLRLSVVKSATFTSVTQAARLSSPQEGQNQGML